MPRKRDDQFTNSVRQPIFGTATYYFRNTDEVISYHAGTAQLGRYGRYDNPNWLTLESTYAAIEGAQAALVFPSGMSAIWTTLLSLLTYGGALAYYGKGYRNIRALCEQVLPQFGIKTVPLQLYSQKAFEESLVESRQYNPRVLFVETPTNPHLYVVDISIIRSILGPDVIIIVDSTFSTPFNFRPLPLGADLVIHSASKYIGGHADLMAGLVAGPTELIEPIRRMRNITGAVISPEVAGLLSRSIETLPLRMSHHNEAGLRFAKAMEESSAVGRVFYSGLESHPSYAQSRRLLSGHGSVVSFEIGENREQCSRFVDSLKIPFMGTNFGGNQSMVEQCAVFTYYGNSSEEREALGISDTLVRYSIGLEPLPEILRDIDQAIEAMR